MLAGVLVTLGGLALFAFLAMLAVAWCDGPEGGSDG